MSKYSLRPYKPPGKPDLKDIYKIFVPSKLYISLRTNTKELWNLEDEQGQVTAVGRVAQAQEDVQNRVLQVTAEFKELFGLNFTDGYVLKRSEYPPRIAQEVVLCEEENDDVVKLSGSDMSDLNRWEGSLATTLVDKLISPGLRLEDIEFEGSKRSFRAESLSSLNCKYGSEDTLQIHAVTRGTRVRIEPNNNTSAVVENFKLDRSGIFGLDAQMDEIDELLEDFHAAKWDPNSINRTGLVVAGGSNLGKTLLMSRISQLSWKRVHQISRTDIGKTPDITLPKLAEECLKVEPCLILIPSLDHHLSESESILEESLEMMFNILKGKRFLIVVEKKEVKLSASLKRCFRKMIQLMPPSEIARRDIVLHTLRSFNKRMDNGDVAATIISQKTPGYSGFDMVDLTESAILLAKYRLWRSRFSTDEQKSGNSLPDEQSVTSTVTLDDLEQARLQTMPSGLNGGQPRSHRKVHWADIGGQEKTKRKVEMLFEWPLKYPEKFKTLGITPGKGLLLYGPPGCSKTMTALALATEAKLNFIPVKGPELLSKYVGESEQNLRNVFARARLIAPCVIFFDEFDAIASSGGMASESQRSVNLVTTLLNELDGVDELKGVSVLAATNRPWEIDSALIRAGRFDDMVYVGLPDEHARRQILQIKLNTMAHSLDIDVEDLVLSTQGCSGAEIVDLCRNAALQALEQQIDRPEIVVGSQHFNSALLGLRQDTTAEMVARFDAFSTRARMN